MNDIEKAIEYWKQFRSEIDDLILKHGGIDVLTKQINPTDLAIQALDNNLLSWLN